MTENERLTFETELGISIDKNEDCPTMSICWNCDIPPRKCNYFKDAIDKLAKYEAIGTIEDFKALKEKSVAKKPTEKELPYSEEVGLNSEWHCPACGSYVGYFTEGMNEPEQMEYCNVCGQHIAKDWSE